MIVAKKYLIQNGTGFVQMERYDVRTVFVYILDRGLLWMRVTVDYDGTGFVSKFKTTYAWLWLKAISRGMQYGRKSADKGYHLKCHFLRIPFWLSLLIRFFLLEDVHRSLFDLQRLKKPKQILWTHKEKRPAGRWSRSLLEVIR